MADSANDLGEGEILGTQGGKSTSGTDLQRAGGCVTIVDSTNHKGNAVRVCATGLSRLAPRLGC